MRKFNIGDKVKVIGNCNGHGYKIGGEYTVKRHESLFIEPNENGYAYNLDAIVNGDVIREKDMDLVKPKEPVLFINPNRLEVKCQDIIVDKYKTQMDFYSKIFNKEKYDLYVKGEWKDMKNEVLELWYSRKQEQIKKEYENLAEKLEKENELINAYKTLIDDFEKSMKDLYEQDDNQEQKIIKELYCDYSYKYGLNCDLVHDMFYEKYRDEMQERLNNLYKTYKEVNAQLSLSDDLDYQIETLINYGILDKKTKKMVD